MELRTDELRVVDLADEFGITISETLALCKMFDIPAPYGSSVITSAGATLLRGLAKGEIDPNSVDSATLAEARGPDYQSEAAASPSPGTSLGSIASEPSGAAGDSAWATEETLSTETRSSETRSSETRSSERLSDSDTDDDFAHLRDESDETTDEDYDYGDPSDYDSFGVAGLDDFPSKPKASAQTPARVAKPVPASTPAPTDSTTEDAGRDSDSAGSAVTPEPPRRVHVDRATERRRSGRRREDEQETKAEYDPSKLRAEYDDIDKYVPKWLKYVALVAIGVFGFLSYQLFFGGSTEVVESGPLQEPIYSAGDCFNADIALWIDTMTTTSCAAEHDGEVFDVFVLTGAPGAAYPDPASLTSQARQSCRGPFAQYTGESSIASEYRIGVSLPSSIEWSKGDRFAYCSTVSADGTQIVGSTAK